MTYDPLSEEYDGIDHRDYRSPRARAMHAAYANELAERTANMPKPTPEQHAALTADMERAWRMKR